MVDKITLSNVVNGSHACLICVVAEILQCLLDKLPITSARLVAEVRATALEYLDNVASRWAGDPNPHHARESCAEITRSSSSTLSNRVAL